MYLAVMYTSSLSSFIQLIGVLVIFVFVLVITYITTRWIAGYQKGQSFNKNLKVVETLKIAQNKFVQIIEVGDEYLVIALGKDEVQLLTKLTREQLGILPSEETQTGIGADSFKELLEKFRKHIPKK